MQDNPKLSCHTTINKSTTL